MAHGKPEDKAETFRLELFSTGKNSSVIEFVEQLLQVRLTDWQRAFLEHADQAQYRFGQRHARAAICRQEGHNLADITEPLERGQGIERSACKRCPLIVVKQTKTWTERGIA
jgi:hypothetical protein